MAASSSRGKRYRLPDGTRAFPKDGSGFTSINSKLLLSWMDKKDIVIPTMQREIDQDAVDKMYKFHQKKKKWNRDHTPLFIMPIVLIAKDGKFNLVDGQHRVALLRRLSDDGSYRMSQIRIGVRYLDCGEDSDYYNECVVQCNTSKGAVVSEEIAPDGSKSVRIINSSSIDGLISRVTKMMSQRYGDRVEKDRSKSAKAPRISKVEFESELRNSQILRKMSPEKVFQIIKMVNRCYGNDDLSFFENRSRIRKLSDSQYERCHSKTQFYLAHVEASCRWIGQIKWDKAASHLN